MINSEIYYEGEGNSATTGLAGCLPLAVIEALQPPKPATDGIVGEVEAKRETINPGIFLAEFKRSVNFTEEESTLRVLLDRTLGRVVRAGEDKYLREEKKGQNESAAYGIGEIDGRECVLYAMHWDYWAGSLGVVAGEKFVKAVDLALEKNLPLIGVFSSAGARQEEGYAALGQMPKISFFADKLKEKNLPFGAILAGQVWGGISASAVPAADFTVVLEGTNVGFSGPRVIKAYTYEDVPEGAQSGEAQVERRNLDLTIKEEELYGWLGRFLKLCEGGQISNDNLIGKPPVIYRRYKEVQKAKVHDKLLGQDLYERYQQLMKNPDRPDIVNILRHAFTDVLPLFSFQDNEMFIKYPAIVAALGKLGHQTVLVIGNQPTYQKRPDGTILKIPASPTPADYDYLMRMLELGKKLKAPAVFYCDTTGAKPTLESEYADIARKIENAIRAENKYPYPIISIVTGILGSGGGSATAPMVDNIVGLSGALICVAEPSSAAAIYKKTTDRKEVGETIRELEMTPYDQLRDKLIDAVIKEPDGGAESNPLEMIRIIQYYTAITILKLNGMSSRRRKHRREDRMRNFRGRPLKGTK